LCDVETKIRFKNNMIECSKDPSCLSCVPKALLDRFNDLRNAFRDDEIEKRRRKYITESFNFTKSKTIMLFTFNYAHR
jgi:hypothetical protein